MLKADDIINSISMSDLAIPNEYRVAILTGYFDRITEVNPEESIRLIEVAKLLRWTFSKL